ncbi:ABC transporter permease [Lactiplantibacillus plantarum]|uniref:ABC transporter permease n=1 Tax=Lactiplantibacillus plantarum TaxID=1590 RepID=UPI0021F763C1|nr:ABC transporter permease [Lactiplantibacillus plantarum]MCW0154666.1 ABC transporter permease [Lactiplantibacillus plantarum]
MNIQKKTISRIKDIRSYPKQNGAVLIAVIISMISVLMIIAAGNGLANNIANQLKPLSSNKLAFVFEGHRASSLHYSDLTFLNDFPEVKKYNLSSDENTASVQVLLDGTEQVATIGTHHNFSSMKLLKGNISSINKNNSVLINNSASWIRPSQTSKLLNKKIYINSIAYIVSGTYTTNLLDGGNLPDLIISENNFNQLGLTVPNDKLTINFKLKQNESLQKLEDKVLNKYTELHANDGTLMVLDDTSLSKSMHSLVNKISTLIVFVASISLIISGFSISSNMYANIAIRSSEIGLRRTLGATQRDIRNQFISEALLLLLFGVLIGDSISQLIILFLKLLNIETYISLSEMFLVGLIPISIGFISSLSPATIAAKKNISELLRSEYI